MQQIIRKLDLEDYVKQLSSFFAREKSFVMEGDIKLHYSLISLLSKYELKPLPKLQNLDTALLHLSKKGTLKLYEIYEFVKIVKYFSYLKKFDFEDKLRKWNDKIIIPDELIELADIFNDKAQIKQGVNEDLDKIEKNIYDLKAQIKHNLYTITSDKKLQLYLVDHQIHFVDEEQTLLVRAGFNHCLKAKVVDRSGAGFFYVVPNNILQLKQKQFNLLNFKDEIIFKLSQQYSSILTNYLPFLKFINKEFDKLDHYLARVEFAKLDDKQFILPSKSKEQKLTKFRHPALHNPKPISIDFSKKVIMITGVNAGGKTMLLKSILSAIFMSKYLIPYKCNKTNTKIGNYKSINVVLDDPQNVKNDISTFAGRMIEFSKLFAKNDFIVGVDEIELGTDSDEASSLFKVIIEKLIKKNIKIIITTHHKKLASLMAINQEVELVAAIYDEKNRKPTYDFIQGTIGKSYAFETASRYKIPLDVVIEAKKVYGEDKNRLNELIERSSILEKQYQQKIKILDKKIDKYKKLSDSLKDEKEKINKIILDEKDILHQKYKIAIIQAKEAIKTKQTAQAHRLLNKAHKQIKDIKIKQYKESPDLKIGSRVKYKNSKGVLLSIKGKKAYVETDEGVKLQVPFNELKQSGDISKVKQAFKHNIKVNIQKSNNGHVTLDLHGQRSDEAIANLDKFISDALIAGFDEVLVYHGIGTGKLSYIVKEFLKKHPNVKDFSDALTGSGGYGAKIVKL